jgi:dUTP pyrophosphatase
MPTRATKGSAGFDLYALDSCVLVPDEAPKLVGTGIAIEFTRDVSNDRYVYEAQIRPRSSLSLVGVQVCFGTVDSDYRGEVGVLMWISHGGPYTITSGQRIAQLVIARAEVCYPLEAETLSETERGSKGFGSTGL